MTAANESLDAVVARIDERVAGLVQRFDSYTETEVLLRQDITASREESRREISAVRVDLERQINDVAARLLRVTLELDGHTVSEVTDNFGWLLTPEPYQDINVLVTDVRLPGLSGVDILRYCADHHPDIYRVAVTGSFDWSDQTTKAAGSASDMLLRKPDDVHQLMGLLREPR